MKNEIHSYFQKKINIQKEEAKHALESIKTLKNEMHEQYINLKYDRDNNHIEAIDDDLYKIRFNGTVLRDVIDGLNNINEDLKNLRKLKKQSQRMASNK